MDITFLGAAQGVTGSKFLVNFDDEHQVLFDCGLFQGLKELRLRNRANPEFNPKNLTAIVLTHAHLDHSGYVPLVVKKGFKGPIYTTPGTLDLCKILLPDAGYIQEEEARFANKHKFSKHHPALPLYTLEEAKASLNYFKPKPYNEEFELFPGCKVTFHRVGHILGASYVQVDYQGKRIVFSGDVGRLNDFLMKPPEALCQTDYLLIESTYGDRKHDDDDPMEELAAVVNRTIKRGGVLIIPSFAVGRTQSILYLLTQLRKQNKIPRVPIYLNSPMATSATKLFCQHPEDHLLSEAECQDINSDVHFVKDTEASIALNAKSEPMIIVAGSGMATGGRVIHHIKHFGGDPKNTILFVGYQAAGTRGQAMLQGAKEIKIHGAYVPIRAEVALIDNLSAHADYPDIINWIKEAKMNPKKVFIVHGEPGAQDHLRLRLQDEFNWDQVVIPKLGESFTL